MTYLYSNLGVNPVAVGGEKWIKGVFAFRAVRERRVNGHQEDLTFLLKKHRTAGVTGE